jgi:hypothetical protein
MEIVAAINRCGTRDPESIVEGAFRALDKILQ